MGMYIVYGLYTLECQSQIHALPHVRAKHNYKCITVYAFALATISFIVGGSVCDSYEKRRENLESLFVNY